MMTLMLALLLAPSVVEGAQTFPPALPDGKTVVTDTSEEFIKAPAGLKEGVTVARAAPTIDFMYYPGQDYPGKPWSVWGDTSFANGKHYSAIGDHLAVDGKNAGPRAGNAFVYEYDPATRTLRRIVDVAAVLKLPDGHYTPGKIHGRLDMGSDGKLYFSTHRGSTRVTIDKYFYKGDWIFRHDPASGATEVLVCGPVPKHCIPCSVLDPDRLIFYGGTAVGSAADGSGVQFFAWDAKAGKMLYSGPEGPARYMILARSTGRVYWTPGKEDMVGPIVRFDPAKPGPPEKLATTLGLRAATQETSQGFVYSVSRGGKGTGATLWAFNTKTETAENLGEAEVGSQAYITTIDVDPSGRYVYYIPGAHGGSERDGTAVVQFDVKTRTRKVIAFLHPFYKTKYGVTPVGTFGSCLDAKGETLYVTWNCNRSGRAWDVTALSVIHIPASERAP